MGGNNQANSTPLPKMKGRRRAAWPAAACPRRSDARRLTRLAAALFAFSSDDGGVGVSRQQFFARLCLSGELRRV